MRRRCDLSPARRTERPTFAARARLGQPARAGVSCSRGAVSAMPSRTEQTYMLASSVAMALEVVEEGQPSEASRVRLEICGGRGSMVDADQGGDLPWPSRSTSHSATSARPVFSWRRRVERFLRRARRPRLCRRASPAGLRSASARRNSRCRWFGQKRSLMGWATLVWRGSTLGSKRPYEPRAPSPGTKGSSAAIRGPSRRSTAWQPRSILTSP